MSTPAAITPLLTVRQVAQRSPAAAAILARHPAARIAGRWSLQELGPFARQSGLDLDALLRELAAAAGVSADPHPAPLAPPAWPPLLAFFAALLITLTVGAGWGAALLLKIAFAADYRAAYSNWVIVHGVEQLWGWVGLSIFGIGSYLLRQTAARKTPLWLGFLSRGLLLAGLLAFLATLGITIPLTRGWVYVAASLCLLAASLLFALEVLLALAGRAWDAAGLFLVAGVQWLLVWAAAEVVIRYAARFHGEPTEAARALLIQLPVLAFTANMIFGFGLRLIPGLLHITRLRPRAALVALVAYNLGLIFLFLGALTPAAGGSSNAGLVSTALLPLQHLPAFFRFAAPLGTLLLMWGAALYLLSLNGLRSTLPLRPIFGVDPRGGFLIRLAFFWLLAALFMILGQQLTQLLSGAPAHTPQGAASPYTGAYRHALTVGFITTMIFGVGHRILPVFMRQPLGAPRLFLAAAWLLALGCAWRILGELATLTGEPWTFYLMGVSGLLELAAIALFALALMRAWHARGHRYVSDDPLLPGTRVRDAVNAHPRLIAAFTALQFPMLEETPAIAPSMTFGGMALALGWRPDQLVEELNRRRSAWAQDASGHIFEAPEESKMGNEPQGNREEKSRAEAG